MFAQTNLLMLKVILIYLNQFHITGLLAGFLTNAAIIYLLKVNIRNTTKSFDICSKLTMTRATSLTSF